MLNNISYIQSLQINKNKKFRTLHSDSDDLYKLSQLICKTATNDKQKYYYIFVWITHNINYDIKGLYNDECFSNNKQHYTNVYINKLGVCDGYSRLYKHMCENVKLKNRIILGKSNTESHAWNMIYYNNKWHLVDCCWGAGYVYNNTFIRKYNSKYFACCPLAFINDHIPFDKYNTLIEHYIKMNDIDYNSLLYKKHNIQSNTNTLYNDYLLFIILNVLFIYNIFYN